MVSERASEGVGPGSNPELVTVWCDCGQLFHVDYLYEIFIVGNISQL